MALALFLLFLVLPFAELYVIIQVAGVLGGPLTILLLVVESILGAWLCKREGAGVLRRINTQLNDGQLPTTELVNGALILLAGALMVTPGFITDILGFFLLLPPTRAIVRVIVLRKLQRRIENAVAGGPGAGFRVMQMGGFGGDPFDNGANDRFDARYGGDFIDVDSTEMHHEPVSRDPSQLGGGRS
jgi:UPF0716 protein FxsA